MEMFDWKINLGIVLLLGVKEEKLQLEVCTVIRSIGNSVRAVISVVVVSFHMIIIIRFTVFNLYTVLLFHRSILKSCC